MKYGLSDQQIEQINQVFSKFPTIESATLFGSRAMGTYKEASDIDIAIQGKEVDTFLAAKLKNYFEEETYLPFFFDVLAYKDIKSDELKEHVGRVGVKIYRKGWVETTLESIAEVIDCEHKTAPKVEQSEYYSIRTTDIKGGKIDLTIANQVSFETYSEWVRRAIPKAGDIILAREAPVGEVGWIKEGCNVCLGQRTVLIKVTSSNVSKKYLLYYLISSSVKYELQVRSTGSVVPHLNMKDIRAFQLFLHPFSEQKTIAKILSSFDEKIEILREQNETLETLAQTIFKEWFINFNYPGSGTLVPHCALSGAKAPLPMNQMMGSELGEIPKGWSHGRLGDVLVVKRGGSPRPIKDYISDSGYRWLKISDASATNSPFIFEIKEHIKTEGLKKTTLLNKGALVLSNSATPGIPNFLEVDSCIHDGWLHFPHTDIFSYQYLYLFFKHIREPLLQQGNGSVFKNLKTDILKNWNVVIPDNETLHKFDELIKPIFEKIKNNASQIQTLTKTRDTLLPKLMSGEVRVS